ncbi:MAG: chromosome partitioning protein ParB [Acidobacteria bacterium]|nr:MAG: chromosome partitioning protein ParB [Acidobacteriota bacterium]
MAKKKVTRRKKVKPASVGPTAAETRLEQAGPLAALGREVDDDGGAVLGSYRDPFGGHEILVAALPIEKVEPTPYQRDASEPHVKRLMTVIEKIGVFLDPIIAVRQDDSYWTPNGNHRLQAMKRLGARSVVALVVPDASVAFKILALNTEKAHNLREKSLEAIRMARELARGAKADERDFAFELEEPSYLTLGFCYEQRPRFSGGAYQPILKRVEDFFDQPLSRALATREARATKLLALDTRVGSVVERLKDKGLKSPYLKPFVVARLNPIRFSKATEFDFDEVFDKMLASAGRFNVDRVKQEDVARAGGSPGGADDV